MVLFSNDFSFILLYFPGFAFSILSLFCWLIAGSFILQKIDQEDDLHFSNFVTNFIETFNKRPIDQRYSKGFFFLIIELLTFIMFQILILSEFFTQSKFNAYFLLFILVLAILLEVFYQLDLSSSSLIFAGKIFSEFIIVISLALLLADQKQTSFVDLSTVIADHISILDVCLFIVIIFSLSKLSTYLDYKKLPTLLSTPNDVSEYTHMIEQGNLDEKYVRWITESFHQILISQLVLLLLFPLIQQLLQLNGPIWIQFILFVGFQAVILVSALFLNLFNSIIEHKMPNQVSKGAIILLLLMVMVVALLNS